MYALVDCNNFYTSCERVFNPALQQRPVVVLSNNDGCIIARSEEAKKLGIPMGKPYFKAKSLCEQHNIAVFSSNYQLYGDMSARVMQILGQYTPNIEIYSIDEAFLDLTGFAHIGFESYAKQIRDSIIQQTGIPVSIGIGPTKTLAKAANHIAKRCTGNGVFSLSDRSVQQSMLQHFEIGDIWGIGRKWSQKLKQINIDTAWKLRNSDPELIRRHFNVVVQRSLYELRGISCIGLEEVPPKKSIICSRSFGKGLTDCTSLEMAVSDFVSRACEKLRAQHSVAQGITVFIRTNPFDKERKSKPYHHSLTIDMAEATNNTHEFIKIAKEAARRLYRQGYVYKKSGIMLLDIISDRQCQPDLFTPLSVKKLEKMNLLMQTLDSINNKIGRYTLFSASVGTKRPWKMRSNKRSPCYTTQWGELLQVH